MVKRHSPGTDGRLVVFCALHTSNLRLPPYPWGSEAWWASLARQGALYLRDGERVTFAPQVGPNLLLADKWFNERVGYLFRFHAATKRPHNGSVKPPTDLGGS